MLGSYPGAPQSCVTEFLLLYTHDVSLSSPQFVRAVAVAVKEEYDILYHAAENTANHDTAKALYIENYY